MKAIPLLHPVSQWDYRTGAAGVRVGQLQREDVVQECEERRVECGRELCRRVRRPMIG